MNKDSALIAATNLLQAQDSGSEALVLHETASIAAAELDAKTEAPSGGGGLVRQDSMNLPAPEDCGVPAEHPEMCILRIRRHHIIEVE